MDGYDGDLAVDAILVRVECWNGADDRANQASVNAGADGLDGPGGFVADERRELRLHEVLTTAEHDLGAVETDGLDAKADLTGGWFGSRNGLQHQNFGITGLVETNNPYSRRNFFWHLFSSKTTAL